MFLFLIVGCSLISSLVASDLFKDLALVEDIDKKQKDQLPFFYNFSMVGGYFNMPSARMPPVGMTGFGGARVSPYNVYGLSFQFFDRLELSANYRVYTGIPAGVFGHEGFGDDAERIGNVKLDINLPEDGAPWLPTFAIGVEDFIGTKRFNSEYIVMTKQWLRANLETTLGWGRQRLKGFFGGISWTPLRQLDLPFLEDISLLAEYDAFNYKKHPSEHPAGRKVNNRINYGLTWVGWNTLQLSVSSLRGREVAGGASLRYPFGTSKGFFKKTHDPLLYHSPIDTEPLGITRPKKEFAQELAYALGMQGLDLYRVAITKDNKTLWIKIINNRYRKEKDMRERLQRVLAALTPSDIAIVEALIEVDGIPSESYRFRTEDLFRYRQGTVANYEMMTLAPMREAISRPSNSELLFRRRKPIWLFTLRPRILTFFGSSTGKFKYNLSLIATPEGYLFDDIYYEAQVGYAISSSTQSLKDLDRLNPSQLPNVRSDTIRYYQTNTFALEMAYLQKTWNFTHGVFFRLAGGYFEPAYGGGAAELLYYPVNSSWAIGIEEATVLKRRYQGVAFTHKIRKLHGHIPHYIHYLGVQYFLDLYYTFKPLDLDFKVMIGQFLAKDKGARFEVGRWFPSGLNVSLWVTVTNGNDHVNGSIYFDKGFAFYLPLDFFMQKSSRSYIGYAMSAWLRDVGAIAATGKRLYYSLRLERM